MGGQDVPPNMRTEKIQMEDPSHKKLDDASEDLFNRIFTTQPQKTAETLNDGRATVRMPDNWQRVDDGKLPPGVSSKGCRPKDNEDVELNLYYRGSALNNQSAKAFHDLLQQPPHRLTNKELGPLRDVLGEKADAGNFTILSAKTENINGKNVLSVEGKYSKFDVTTQVLYVDTHHDGSMVEELSYTAPSKVYAKYMLDAKKSFESLLYR